MYSFLEYEDAPEPVKKIYDDIFECLGNEGLVDYFKVLGHYNIIVLDVTWNMLKSILVEGELPRALKELVFIAVSNENNCSYCTDIHTAMCKFLNLNEGDIQKVLKKETNLNPKRVKLSIDFSRKMAINPGLIVESDHQTLLDAGLTKSQIFELMALVSLVNYSNTLAQGMMIDVDQKVVNLLNV
ncbi:MAG: hypothetical protein COA76_00810 [Moritella sp.]|nr:MAG: hypothetical protein COA76_00810 [Moritella sp.]